jgi:hypothetical protein
MSEATWKESLKTVFKDIDSAANVDPDGFVELLRNNGIAVHDDIEKSFDTLESVKEKREIVQFLWELAHLDELEPGKRHDLYDKVAKHYELLFEWEEVDAPGWILLPGPLPP